MFLWKVIFSLNVYVSVFKVCIPNAETVVNQVPQLLPLIGSFLTIDNFIYLADVHILLARV